MEPMSASKAWICCPLDLKATSRIKRETGIVSDAMSMQPSHPAQNVPGEEPNPQPHNPSRLSVIFLPALPCALPTPPPAAYPPEDWLPFSRRLCWLHILSLVFLRVGRNSCTTAPILRQRGGREKRYMFGAGEIYSFCSPSHWDPLFLFALTPSSLAAPPSHLPAFSNCTANGQKI